MISWTKTDFEYLAKYSDVLPTMLRLLEALTQKEEISTKGIFELVESAKNQLER